MLKIFLMARNNLRELQCTVKSIQHRTRVQHQIIVVDNASTDHNLVEWLNEQISLGRLSAVFNKYNLWVLGLNNAIKKYLKSEDEYFLVSDSDIIVPFYGTGDCWLGRLHCQIRQFPCIGKLGLSLDLGYIKSRTEFGNTYSRELNYLMNDRIGSNIIAPVDTTMAIYRSDYFLTNSPRFVPGHGVMGRPYFYCCRTDRSFRCKHIGWRSYNKSANMETRLSKALCFTLMGAYLDPVFISNLPKYAQLFYFLARPIARMFWGLVVYALQFSWFLKYAPHRLNKVQFNAKCNVTDHAD